MRSFALTIPFIAIFVLFHVLSANGSGSFSNVSPYLALFFCGAMYWRQSKLLLPLALICTLITPFITMAVAGHDIAWSTTLQPLIVPLFAYAAIVWFGLQLGQRSALPTLTAALGCGIFFHLVTNLWCFATSTLYGKNFHGLAQALWTTPDFPGAMPTAIFLRNTCASTVLFTLLFLLAAKAPWFRPRETQKARAIASKA